MNLARAGPIKICPLSRLLISTEMCVFIAPHARVHRIHGDDAAHAIHSTPKPRRRDDTTSSIDTAVRPSKSPAKFSDSLYTVRSPYSTRDCAIDCDFSPSAAHLSPPPARGVFQRSSATPTKQFLLSNCVHERRESGSGCKRRWRYTVQRTVSGCRR